MGVLDFFNRKKELPKSKGTTIQLSGNSLYRIRQDAQTRKDAIREAEQCFNPRRVRLQDMYLNTAENGFIKACIDKRKDLTLLRKWDFKNIDGKTNDDVLRIFFNIVDGKLIKKNWFENFINYALDARYFGYSLIYLGDVINNEITGTAIHPRANVNPDTYTASAFRYGIGGVNFIEDETASINYVYVDTPTDYGNSCCGYGLFFWLSVYEILLRNIMIFNADYTEVNVAPFRQVKTHKRDTEQEELFNAAVNMASCGVAVTDHTDDIIFHPSGGGTGYVAYDNFEERIEAKVSQLILGHADAMKSIAGKLGNDSADSPAQMALRDKQTNDGEFIINIVNNLLIPKLRLRGFNIPEGITASLLNDNEEMDNANNVLDLAVKMKQAGLQIDSKYVTEQTNIPVMEQVIKPTPKFGTVITNKLNKLYK